MTEPSRATILAELRRARIERAPVILRGGFRPFFLGAAAWAAIALTLWLLAFFGSINLAAGMDATAWHRHEMLFGFVGAAIAGFLLTAIPNWTGRLPIAGAPLAGLFGLWLAGRLILLLGGPRWLGGAAIADIGFYVLLAALFAREVLAANNRNLMVVFIVLLLAGADAADYCAAFGWIDDPLLGVRAALGLIVVLISLIGGRIIPSFTRNWMMKNGPKQGLPHQPGRFDMLTIGITAVAMAGWVFASESRALAGVITIAALLQGIRLMRWNGIGAARDPLVLILHVGYAWLPVGLFLLSASMVSSGMPVSSAIHALAAGAIATMILAMITRASLGHTGHPLRASLSIVVAYALLTTGAVLRVIAPLGIIQYASAIRLAGATWIAAFLVFLVVYVPILAGPRGDNK